jgi:hypothetical protein
MEIGESNTEFRNFVDVGRANLASVAAQVTETQVVLRRSSDQTDFKFKLEPTHSDDYQEVGAFVGHRWALSWKLRWTLRRGRIDPRKRGFGRVIAFEQALRNTRQARTIDGSGDSRGCRRPKAFSILFHTTTVASRNESVRHFISTLLFNPMYLVWHILLLASPTGLLRQFATFSASRQAYASPRGPLTVMCWRVM